MRKLLAVLPLAAAVFAAACSDVPTAPLAQSPAAAAASGGTGGASTKVTVAGTFSATLPGGEVIRESGPGINDEGKEMGLCGLGGAWQNPSNKEWSRSVPHSHCKTVSEGRTVTWEFSARATFVVNKNNTNLNFQDLDDYYVHFQGNQNRTNAEGVFTHETDGGVWTLDLAQFAAGGNAFVACDGGTCLEPAAATFTYEGVEYQATDNTLRW